MKRIVFASLGLLLVMALWQTPSLAQTHSPTPRAEGELKGMVLDLRDSRVMGAKITLENKKYKFEAWSNDEGVFKVMLPAGEYRLKIESGGFKAYVKRVRVETDKTENINATLSPAGSTYLLKVK